MTDKQQRLEKIVNRRTKFMRKTWTTTVCNFDFKTYVEVSFVNSEDDFRTTRYPNIDEAILQQTEKLRRDVKSFVNGDTDIKRLIDFLLV